MGVGTLTNYGLPFSNVVPSGIATNNIVQGLTLETMRLALGGGAFTKAMIDLIKFKVNGKVILEASGTQLDKINAYRGEATADNFIDLHFADYSMLTDFDRMVGAFDTTFGVDNITTEVKIVGATAPTLKPILVQSATQRDYKSGQYKGYAGLMSKLLRYPYNTATGGKMLVQLPFGEAGGSIIKRIHIFNTGQVNGVTIKENSLVIHESEKAENEFAQVKAGRVPQVGVYTVDFALHGNVAKAFNNQKSKSMELLLDLEAAENGFVVVEYIDTLANL